VLSRGSDWFARFLKGVPNGIDTRPPVELAADPYRELGGAGYTAPPPTRTVTVSFPGRATIASNGSLVRRAGRTQTLLETFGAPLVRVRASGTYPHLVAVLKAVAPDGEEITVSEGGAKVRLGRRPRTVAIRMISQATTVPRGSRLFLRLGPTSGDLLYITTVPTGTRATLGPATVRLPVLMRPISG
jgi:hypothetical protein